jgi:hypothetical protein
MNFSTSSDIQNSRCMPGEKEDGVRQSVNVARLDSTEMKLPRMGLG